MLYESLNQGIVFIQILSFSILISFLDEIIFLLFHKLKNKIITGIVDFLRTIIFCLLYYISLVLFCFGEIRLFTIITYIFGIIISKSIFASLKKQIIRKKLLKLLKKKKEI